MIPKNIWGFMDAIWLTGAGISLYLFNVWYLKNFDHLIIGNIMAFLFIAIGKLDEIKDRIKK